MGTRAHQWLRPDRSVDNVITTPHISPQSDSIDARVRGLIRDNIARLLKGEPMLKVVDKVKGY